LSGTNAPAAWMRWPIVPWPNTELDVHGHYEPHTTADFWDCYGRLPTAVQRLADVNYELLRENPCVRRYTRRLWVPPRLA
jgi:hypothetical protein